MTSTIQRRAVALVAFVTLFGSPLTVRAEVVARPGVAESYGKLDLRFEENQGQTDGVVKYIARGDGYVVFLTASEAVLKLGSSAAKSEPAVIRMRVAGANKRPEVTGVDRQTTKTNYLIGNDATKWLRHVPSFAAVKYAEVYDGIDLVYHGNQRQLEYDFVVAPGADPRKIRLDFDGVKRLSIDGEGNLVLATSQGDLIQRKPVVYQDVDGERRFVDGRYIIRGRRGASFQVARYDTSRSLVIDPIFVYSSYLGGSTGDAGRAIAVDASGSAYVVGDTGSPDFPTAFPIQSTNPGAGGWEGFVAKLSPAGNSLEYSTYLGGTHEDLARGVAVDSAGSAYVVGRTSSPDFPTANPIQGLIRGTDAFIAKLSPEGDRLLYSTFLGGTGDDRGESIAVDQGGNAFVSGMTNSYASSSCQDCVPFPTVNAHQPALNGPTDPSLSREFDFFVAKVNAAGNALVYSTYFGGRAREYEYNRSRAIAVDSSGAAWITGETYSTDFPTLNPLQAAYGGAGDAIVAKFGPTGTLLYSSYLGATELDSGRAIAVDSGGDAYLTGYTASVNFPTVGALQPLNASNGDVFVHKDQSGRQQSALFDISRRYK